MKYAMNSELLASNTDMLQDDNVSNAFQFFINMLKSSYTRGYKLFKALLCGAFTGCLSKTLYKDVYADYLFYKEHCNGKMSYRVWCRYGAMLLDVDHDKYCRDTHSNDKQTGNELDLKQERVDKTVITTDLAPFTIKVKNFKPYSA